MYCVNCGKQMAAEAKFCQGCGMAVGKDMPSSPPPPSAPPSGPTPPRSGAEIAGSPSVGEEANKQVAFVGVGALLGAVVGFAVRPSAFLFGKLPLMVVLTAGTTLQGLDAAFVPMARQSFGMLVGGVILGAFGGAMLARGMSKAG